MKKEILVSLEFQNKKVAVVEDGHLEEYYVERLSDKQLVGSIYKGKVSSIVPGIGAAFIDIGLEKNGFLYVADVVGQGGLDGEDADYGENGDKPEGEGTAAPQPPSRQHHSHGRRDNDGEVLVALEGSVPPSVMGFLHAHSGSSPPQENGSPRPAGNSEVPGEQRFRATAGRRARPDPTKVARRRAPSRVSRR